MLSPAQILDLWEAGQDVPAAARPTWLLAGLGLAGDALSMGAADRALLDLYRRAFGPRLAGLASCAGCGERVEIELAVADLDAGRGAPGEGGPPEIEKLEVEEGAWRATFRLPGPADLAAASDAGDLASARALLLSRCVLRAERDGRAMPASRLPARTVAAIAARMERADPQAAIELAGACPACARELRAGLDPARFVWAAIEGEALRLLHEIDALARAYGWREGDVLALGPRRRRAYLELVA